MSRWVDSIEIDEDLCQVTQKVVKPFQNIKVIHTDILKFNFPKNKDYKIFGNIPFNISTDIVKKIAFESNSKYSYLIVENGFAKKITKYETSFRFAIDGGIGHKSSQKSATSIFSP